MNVTARIMGDSRGYGLGLAQWTKRQTHNASNAYLTIRCNLRRIEQRSGLTATVVYTADALRPVVAFSSDRCVSVEARPSRVQLQRSGRAACRLANRDVLDPAVRSPTMGFI